MLSSLRLILWCKGVRDIPSTSVVLQTNSAAAVIYGIWDEIVKVMRLHP
jgi:hypothetical protein